MRKATFVLVLVAFSTWNPSIDPALATAQGGTLTGTVMVRERANDDESLLIGVTGADDKPVTRLEVTLPDRFSLRIGYVPQGWTAKVDGKQVTANGPSAARVHLRLDASPREQILKKLSGKRCRLRAWRDDELLFGIEHAILPDYRVGTQWTLDDAITLPPVVSIGDPFMATPAPNFRNGEWKLILPDTASDPARLESWKLNVERIQGWNALLAERALFGVVAPHLRFQYTDPWGDVQVDQRPSRWLTPPKMPEGCTTGVTGGATLAFAGKPTCLTGCFDDLGSALAILLDETQPLEPLALSRSSIVVGVPDGAVPGLHTFSARQGKASLGTQTIRVIGLNGAIDQSQLWRGQSTTMRLDIVGHDQPVPLAVVNRTPAIIDVQGGVRQTVSTSGGTPNGAARSVRGIMKGDFAIDYSLDLPPCGLPK